MLDLMNFETDLKVLEIFFPVFSKVRRITG